MSAAKVGAGGLFIPYLFVAISSSVTFISFISALFLLQKLVVLVTGGASGLGSACVQRFARQGNKVVIADLPSSKGNELAKSLGSSAIFTPVDVGVTSDRLNYRSILLFR